MGGKKTARGRQEKHRSLFSIIQVLQSHYNYIAGTLCYFYTTIFIFTTQLKDKFYQDYSMGEIFNSSDVYHNQKLQNILTLHPLKSPRLMYRVHQFFLELALSRAESKAEHVHWDLEKISALTGKGHAFS